MPLVWSPTLQGMRGFNMVIRTHLHTEILRGTQKTIEVHKKHGQHALTHTHSSVEGPRKEVGMDPALRATQSQSKLMIAQTFTQSIQPPRRFLALSLSLYRTQTHVHKHFFPKMPSGVIATIVTVSLTEGGNEIKGGEMLRLEETCALLCEDLDTDGRG